MWWRVLGFRFSCGNWCSYAQELQDEKLNKMIWNVNVYFVFFVCFLSDYTQYVARNVESAYICKSSLYLECDLVQGPALHVKTPTSFFCVKTLSEVEAQQSCGRGRVFVRKSWSASRWYDRVSNLSGFWLWDTLLVNPGLSKFSFSTYLHDPQIVYSIRDKDDTVRDVRHGSPFLTCSVLFFFERKGVPGRYEVRHFCLFCFKLHLKWDKFYCRCLSFEGFAHLTTSQTHCHSLWILQ